MRRWKITVAALTFSAPATAQQAPVTLNMSPITEGARSLREVQGATNRRLEDQQALQTQQLADQAALAGREAQRSRVLGMAATGQCEQARTTALAGGDIGLAGEVAGSCRR